MGVTAQQLAQRISAAREVAKLSQSELADRVGLTQSAISRIESADRAVGSLELARIAEAVGGSVADLLSDTPSDDLLVAARARNDTRLTEAVRRARTILDVHALLDELDYPSPHRGDLARPTRVGRRLRDAAVLAERIRTDLGMPQGPLDLLEVVIDERFGIHVALMPTRGVDGLCATTSRGTVIIADSDAATGPRRFTLAHELGHWLAGHGDALHVDEKVMRPDNGAEKWANKFAITFLAPPTGLRARLDADTEPAPETVLRLSLSYGVSYEALVWHLHNNDLITEAHRVALHRERPATIAFSSGLGTQWNSQRSGVEPTPPHSLTERVISAYRDGRVGIGPVADVLGGSDLDDLRAELEDRAPIEAPYAFTHDPPF